MFHPQLLAASGFTVGDTFFAIFTFMILLALIRVFAWKPLMKIMKEREEHILAEINSAETSKTQAESLLAEQKKVLKSARQEAQNMIDNAKQLGEKERENLIILANNEAKRLKKEAKAEIEREKEMAIADLRNQVGSLSVLIAAKVMEKNVKETDQEEVISHFIERLGDH